MGDPRFILFTAIVNWKTNGFNWCPILGNKKKQDTVWHMNGDILTTILDEITYSYLPGRSYVMT